MITFETCRSVIYPHHIDHMGHMNVQHYVHFFDVATWHLLNLMGAGPEYMKTQNVSLVAAEQKISYMNELLAGDLIVVRSAPGELGKSSFKFSHELFRLEGDLLCARVETVGVQIDRQTRKPRPVSEEVAARWRSFLNAD